MNEELRKLREERLSRAANAATNTLEIVYKNFDKQARELKENMKDILRGITDASIFCIDTEIYPVIKNIENAKAYQKRIQTEDELLREMGNMTGYLNKLPKQRNYCIEYLNQEKAASEDYESQRKSLEKLIFGLNDSFLDKKNEEIHSYYEKVSKKIEEKYENIDKKVAEVKKVADEYFEELSVLVFTFIVTNFQRMRDKFENLKESYFKVFGERKMIDLQFDMETQDDQKLARQLSRRLNIRN